MELLQPTKRAGFVMTRQKMGGMSTDYVKAVIPLPGFLKKEETILSRWCTYAEAIY